MARFAKLFEVEDGEQLLVVRGTDDNGDPQVQFTIEHEGMKISIGPTWRPTPNVGDDECARLADALFEEYDQAMAEGQRARMITMINEMASG